MTPSEHRLRMREALPIDDAGMLAIWNREVTDGDATFETTPRTLNEQGAWRVAHAPPFVAIVALVDERLVGFGALAPYRANSSYRFAAEVATYVDAAERRRGYGLQILQRLIALASLGGFHTLMARITGGNANSIRLHERCEFQVVGVERELGFKFGLWKDVVLMQRLISSTPPPRSTRSETGA